MTTPDLHELAAGTLLTSFAGAEVPGWLLESVVAGAGGVCLYGSNRDADFRAVSEQLHGARDSVVLACDEEGGDVTRLEARIGSSVPGNAALGVLDDPDMTRVVAAALGDALRGAGVDLDLAPCADINSDPANPIVGVRSFGSDPQLVARHTAAFVVGLHDAGVAACAKHFPGHGAVGVDSHHELPVLDATAIVLAERELVPFRAAIAAGVDAVMPGHLLVPSLDRRPATVSGPIIAGLRRLGFAGAVVTDALDMGGIGGARRMPDNVVAALAAGADLCCLGPDNDTPLFDACVAAVVAAVRAGRLDEARVGDAASRVARLRRRPPEEHAARDLGAIGNEAAVRAVTVDGELPRRLMGAHVIELDRPENLAVGTVPWGPGLALRDRDPSVTVTRLGAAGAERVGDVLAAAHGVPLVLVVRDAHRVAPLASAVDVVLAARPDTIVVDMGWPSPVEAPAAVRIRTYGASRASGDVVAALLAGEGSGVRSSAERITNG